MANSTAKPASNNTMVVVFLLITLIVLGVAGLLGKSLVTSIIRDAKVVSAKSKASKQLDANLLSAPKLVDNYKALGSQQQTLADALPTNVDFPALLVVMENMGLSSGITVKTVSPVITTAASGSTTPKSSSTGSAGMAVPQVYPFTITFEGSYAGLQRFFDNIEKSARPMRVVGMQLSGTGSSLTGTIDMQTYYQDRAVLPFSTETIK